MLRRLDELEGTRYKSEGATPAAVANYRGDGAAASYTSVGGAHASSRAASVPRGRKARSTSPPSLPTPSSLLGLCLGGERLGGERSPQRSSRERHRARRAEEFLLTRTRRLELLHVLENSGGTPEGLRNAVNALVEAFDTPPPSEVATTTYSPEFADGLFAAAAAGLPLVQPSGKPSGRSSGKPSGKAGGKPSGKPPSQRKHPRSHAHGHGHPHRASGREVMGVGGEVVGVGEPAERRPAHPHASQHARQTGSAGQQRKKGRERGKPEDVAHARF